MISQNGRETRAAEIFHNGMIEQVGALTFAVKSQTKDIKYEVKLENGVWTCQCPDHIYRHRDCKHILAVKEVLVA
jgi:uncharacterized Zn finger protein